MEPYPSKSEAKISNQNLSDKKIVPKNSNNIEINRTDEPNISQKNPNRLISFLTSKIGIIVIAISIIVIAIGIFLSVYLARNNGNENNISKNKIFNDKIINNIIDKNSDYIETMKADKNSEKDEEKEKGKDEFVCKSKIPSDTLYVKKIDNLPEDFILGMDLSSLISEENSGVKYYNFKGEEKDVLETLRYVGINYIRIRIWNDPYDSEGKAYGGGNNDMKAAIKIGKRATKYGMKILASYHYSDFYADPANQNVPKAWRGLNLEGKAKQAEKFTRHSLQQFKDAGVDVGMVALGNEINDFFCGEHEWPNIVKILKACSKATREVLPNAKISVHFTNPDRPGSMMYFAKSLADNSLDYDIFSVSYYNVWAGDLNCLDQLNDVANTYNKKIFVAETQYPYTRDNLDYYPNKTPGYDDFLYYPITVQGQATHIRNLLNHIHGLKNGIGLFYWEGAWIGVGTKNYYENLEKWEKYGSGWASNASSSYSEAYFGGGGSTENQALFDSEGKPLESLKVYNLIKYGNEINTFEDGVEDISVNPINFSTFSLPNEIKVIDTSDQRSTRNIIWNGELDIEKSKNDEKYEYIGKADNIDIKCIFENNLNNGRRFVCSYYIGDKMLSPLLLKSMIRIREG